MKKLCLCLDGDLPLRSKWLGPKIMFFFHYVGKVFYCMYKLWLTWTCHKWWMIILIFLTKISWKGCDYFSFFRKLGARKFEKGGQTKIDQVWFWQEEKRGAFFVSIRCRKTIYLEINILFSVFHTKKYLFDLKVLICIYFHLFHS